MRGVVDAATGGRTGRGDRSDESPARPDAAAYQRRRDVNVARLKRVDRLVAQSRRVAEIYRELGVDGDNLRTLGLTLAHLEGLRPRTLATPPRPVTFATIDGCAARSKGLDLILHALRRLTAAGAEGSFRLLVLGHVAPAAEAELERHPAVSVRGLFAPAQLDARLDEVDVGLVPSVWEEAYGFVGMEFLAKGIPLIANEIGGIVDYAREGETAWLNRSCTGDELADLMLAAVQDPGRVVELHRSVVALRPRLVKGMDAHAAEMDALYEELLA
jgi:glycosyltransferase involved in cell wall biosynthesis